MSIDSLKHERYSQIRLDGNLDTVLKNVERLVDYRNRREAKEGHDIGLTLHFLVMKDNWDELSEVLDFVDQRRILITFNNCYEPSEQSLISLSDNEQLLIAKHWIDNYPWAKVQRMMRSILSVAHDLPAILRAEVFLNLKKKKEEAVGNLTL
jgi:molybdenum cofactor biosynthesis enzyme MoaA